MLKISKKDHLKASLAIGWELSLKGILFRSSVTSLESQILPLVAKPLKAFEIS